MADQINEHEKTFRIPLGEDYNLSKERLDKYAGKQIPGNNDWRWPSLKFQSYKNGVLTLLNNHKGSSFKLMLKVDGHELLVNCSCGSLHICSHARAGLSRLIIMQGEDYFKKLRRGESFDLAFAYGNYFDKKESTSGINVYPRPELKSVFQLSDTPQPFELQGILNLPGLKDEEAEVSGEGIAYLVLVPWSKCILPAVLPCVSQLNKERNHIKTWIDYLFMTKGKYDYLINGRNEELISCCTQLWNYIYENYHPPFSQKMPRSLETMSTGFDLWEKIFTFLRKQDFVYAYQFYGIRETRMRPFKKKAWKIRVSDKSPSLKFVLLDKGPFYEFHMQVWLEGELLEDIQYITCYFILHDNMLYRVPVLREALIIDWFTDSGGWITVFKEHYDQFMEEVLVHLKDKYPVDKIPAKKKSKVSNHESL